MAIEAALAHGPRRAACWCRRSPSPRPWPASSSSASATAWPSCIRRSPTPSAPTSGAGFAPGRRPVVVGTRSGVFAPVRNLGLIVVDEEHDQSYKQDETPRYNGRDVAIVRAQAAGACVILGSATPSLESRYNADRGKYTLLELPERIEQPSPAPGGADRHAGGVPGDAQAVHLLPEARRAPSASAWPTASRPCCCSTGAASPVSWRAGRAASGCSASTAR